MSTKTIEKSANRDPLSGAAGAHPVGTGIGAVLGGAAAGAATGTVAGPVGTLVGTAIGAIVGGLAGKEVAESVDPTAEEAYWRKIYSSRPYVDPSLTFDDYGPAYTYGVSAYGSYPDQSFEEVEPELSRGWTERRGGSRLDWPRARSATKDAWDRLSNGVERAIPGDSDRDGR